MKAAPLLVAWHDNNDPIYSAHFEPHGKGRLATAGGDSLVRLWSIEASGDERKVTYLSTLEKHSQAVNVVRWCPRGEILASAGDDGNVLLWTPTDNAAHATAYGKDKSEDVEHWRVKIMCRSNSGAEIYDLAWSPDGKYFITGSMDNVARIHDAQTGAMVRQLAEHSHYVQGVAWDPLNEFVATQSSDRSVHVYSLKTKDGQFSLHNKASKMDMPGRRISSNSPAPPDFGLGNHRSSLAVAQDAVSESMGSPKPSAPGTPQSLAVSMNPPPTTHSRRSSFGSHMSQSMRQRSQSPSPSMPLPAVMPSPSLSGSMTSALKNAHLYANETFTSFFRRLTFTPDGSLLFTPSGQYKMARPAGDTTKTADEIINTVYIYTRAGLNKPPVAYMPGHRKPSVAVKCSPVLYQLRANVVETKEITIDTRNDDDIPTLPEPIMPTKLGTTQSAMDPPPITSAPSPAPSATLPSPHPHLDSDSSSLPGPPLGPVSAFDLPYRIICAVATQDAVYLYDTQQTKPICIVSNLHYATFTDLTWSTDGLTLLMTSSDGFCSCLTFAAGELGAIYHPPANSSQTAKHQPAPISIGRANSATSTPQPTPAGQPPLPAAPSFHRKTSSQGISAQPTPVNPSPSPFSSMSFPGPGSIRPASPARSMSASSIATEASFARIGVPDPNNLAATASNPVVVGPPTPSLSAMPSLAAASGSSSTSNPPVNVAGVPLFTPPQTPSQSAAVTATTAHSTVVPPTAGTKREHPANLESVDEEAASSAQDQQGREKRRRIAPTLVSSGPNEVLAAPPPPPAPSSTGEPE